MENLFAINGRLKRLYGLGPDNLSALFRVVLGNDQTEMRIGDFVKETEAGIYLGHEICAREAKKYPMWPDFWILEVLQINENNQELLSKYSYEPLWRFRDKNDRPLPYDWEVIERILHFYFTGKAGQDKRTQRDIDQAAQEKLEAEKIAMLDELRSERPFKNSLYDSAKVTIPGNFEKDK